MRIVRIAPGWALLIIALIGFDTSLPAQELTVDEAVRLGLERNPRLRAAEADAAAARAAQDEVRSARLPAFRSQLGFTRLGGQIPTGEFVLPGLDTAITILPIEMNRYHSELSVEQPLFTGFRLRNQARAAAHEADAASLLAAQEAADVALEIRRAYWMLAASIAVRDAVDGALVQVEEHLRNVRTRVEAGAALTSELLAAQTRRSEVLLERLEAENGVRLARLELSRLTGLPLDTPVQPVETVSVELVTESLESLTTRAVEARPQLRALGEQVRSLQAQLDVARGARLPEVAFVGRYIYSRPNPYAFIEQDQFRGTWEAGVSLQWGLWEGGRRQAQVGQARARVQAAEARLSDVREQVAVEIAREFLEAQRAAEAIEVADLNVQEAQETFRVVRQQFDEGVALSAQVLDAEQALRAASSRRARAIAEQRIARAALLRAVGEVW